MEEWEIEKYKNARGEKLVGDYLLTISQNCDIIFIMKDWNELKKELLKNPEFRKLYEESQLEFEIAKAIIKTRLKRKMTQKELAKRMRTTQSVISRIEQARTSPSISFLKRVARALNASLQIHFRYPSKS